MMSNDAVADRDSCNFDIASDDNDENEILCSACGFSSECVPEGMLACPKNCTIVNYCSVECRDWAWNGSHKNDCPVANATAAGSMLPANDTTLKSNNSSFTSIKSDSGKLGESFSDGSVSVASSIEAKNLFDAKPSPFFSKNKFGQFTSKSNAVSPLKQLPSTAKVTGLESSSANTSSNGSDAQNVASIATKRGPNVTKTLGNHFNGKAPNQIKPKQLFVVSTDSDEDSDDGDNDSFHEENTNEDTFDHMAEDESVGMSVLNEESVANLTAIVEESSNLMSVPVIEASWRRTRQDQNPNERRLNTIISKPSQGSLDMEDSEIIGTDSLADVLTMQQHDALILQQQDDLAYGVKSNSGSESISSVMGNQNSAMFLSMTTHETSDEEDLSYSQASGSYQGDDSSHEAAQKPEVVESSNSSDSATEPDYIPSNNSGTLGGRPSMTLHRGPSLRGFRDAYNECDTASLHSRSVRSLSSSEDSLSSHCDVATDIPERMQRSSSSLKDFRDIYNADFKQSLLREPSTDSLGCSASFDYTSDKMLSPMKVTNDSKLTRQLELISSKSEMAVISVQDQETHKSETSSLLMARIRNESMKESLNSALRVYEEMYGEDAAKDVFHQLTSTADSNARQKNTSKGVPMIEWKRSDELNQGNHPIPADVTNSILPSKSIPKYLQYRTSLSSTKLTDDATPATKPDYISHQQASNDIDSIRKDPANDVTSKSVPKYLQYRTSLSGSSLHDEGAASTNPTNPDENAPPSNIAQIDPDTQNYPSSKSIPKYMQYRTSLSGSKLTDEIASLSNSHRPNEQPNSQATTADIDPIQTTTENIMSAKSTPKYMQYRSTLSSKSVNTEVVLSTQHDTQDRQVQNSDIGPIQTDSINDLPSKSIPKYMQYRSTLSSIKVNDAVLHVPNESAESENVKIDASAPVVSARYLQYRDKLLKEGSNATRSTSSLQHVELRNLVADTKSTTMSDDPISVSGTKSSGNLSCTVNSSSDAGYLPLDVLSTQLLSEVDIQEVPVPSTSSEPQAQSQISQRYLQYRESITKPMVSGIVHSTPMTAGNDEINALVSSQDHRGMVYTSEPTQEQVDQEPIVATHATSSQSDSDIHVLPRYLSYRHSLESIHGVVPVDKTKNADIIVGRDVSTSANSVGNGTIDDSEVSRDTEVVQQNKVPSSDLSAYSVPDIQFEETELDPENVDGGVNFNPDAFKFAFDERYKKNKSSVTSLMDGEDNEYVDHLSKGKIREVDEQYDSGEIAHVKNNIGLKKTHAYQIVDLDESTHEVQSGDGLENIGYSGVFCGGATVDTESFLLIWNEMEADRNSLCEERNAYESSLKHMPQTPTIQKKNKELGVPVLPSATTGNQLQGEIPDIMMDIEKIMDVETGLFPPSEENDQFMDKDMQLRAKKYRRKQHTWWCIMTFLLVALPLGIGLGISLGRSDPLFPPTPGVINHSTVVPAVSPVVVPPPTISMPTSPEMTAPTLAPISAQVPTVAQTSIPSTKPVATATNSPTASPVVQISVSPTQLLPKSRNELLDLIVRESFDNGTAIQSTGSPQYMAFEWLVLDQANTTFVYPNERIIQRFALATLYYSTDGENWGDNLRWLSKDDECTWHTLTSIENCDSEGVYKSLDLSANDLTGVVPNELALLSRLEHLKMSGGPSRFIGGVIPSALSYLTSLKVVDFQQNALFGVIPSELGNLGKLEVLDVSMNRLVQTIPTHLGRLTLLKKLSLAGNNLTGEIPSTLQNMSLLERFSLGDNNFSGPLQLGTGMSMLKSLNLEKNRFSSIGTEIGLLQGLEVMTIHDNALAGSLPTQFTRMLSLVSIDLHGNNLTGSIPSDIGNLSMLTHLDLSGNQFSSKIPSSIGQLTNLVKLHLHRNRLEGSIPIELGMLSSAYTIRINENDISGSVPEEVCENFGIVNPLFYLDCLPQSDGFVEINCPPGKCCAVCCNDEGACECKYRGTTFEFLCDTQQ